MTRSFRAAVLGRVGEPMSIETVQLDSLRPGDALVRIEATSICHTDLEIFQGQLHAPVPTVLGHEGAGVVEEVGEGVGRVQPGDRVVLSWNPHCGQCFYCARGQPILCETYQANAENSFHYDGAPRLSLQGAPLHVLMYLGTFAEYCVVPAQAAIVVPDAIPPDRACLIGCGVMTGFGATTNVAPVKWGSTAAVVGCGALGLSAVQGARLCGASAVLAVDINDKRLEVAQAVGATHLCNPASADPVAAARAVSDGRGVDNVFESAGSAQAFRLSLDVARPGASVVWLGKVRVDDEVSFKWGALMAERRIVRSSYGGARPINDFPRIAAAYLDGRLKLDEMVTARIQLEQINEAFDALKRGETIRTVIDMT